jgi:DNA-binding Lrp family transcriptional regulator
MIDELDYRLLTAVQQGLPITTRPYATIAEQLGLSEPDLLERLKYLKEQGLIKRWGVVVKHRQLGYRANAMVVLDVPDHLVSDLGFRLSRQSYINLCYQRPRQGQLWPYNLYCMIHGKCRDTVLAQWQEAVDACGLYGYSYEILFSRRCFKQRGALYTQPERPVLDAQHG